MLSITVFLLSLIILIASLFLLQSLYRTKYICEMNITDKIPDLKNYLKIYLPNLFLLYKDDELNWKTINNSFLKWYKKNKEEYYSRQENGIVDPFNIPATFFTVINRFWNGDPLAQGLFIFFNELFQALSKKLHDQEKKLIKSSFNNMLSKRNLEYLDFLGEIACINAIKEDENLSLIKYEHKLKNNQEIDFTLYDKKENKNIFIEVYNLHLKEITSDVEKFIGYRVQKKLGNKFKDMPEPEIELNILPVLWGQPKQLAVFSDFYKKNKMNMENVQIPFAFIYFSNDKSYEVKFGRIDRIL